MNDQEKLNGYIYRQLQAGLQPEEIAQQLRTAGWDEATIARSFEAARATLTPLAQPITPPVQQVVASPSSQPSPIVQQMATGPAVSFAPTGQKRGRIKTGWLLLKQSMKVLLHNKQLIRYPFMGGLMSLLLTIIFAVIVVAGHSIFLVHSVDSAGKSVWTANLYGNMLGAVYYVLTFFVIFLYNAGLAAHVLDIFRGTSQPYKHYMKVAWSKRVPIFFYAIITATVGFILRTIEQRFKFLGFFISKIFGALWTLANLFTIPVIVESDSSAPSAIKQSTKLFLSRWGENITARITFGGLAFGLYLLLLIPLFIVTVMLGGLLGAVGIIIGFVIIFISIIAFATVETAAESILSTGLYYYAKYEQIPGAYDPELLNATFIPKKQK